MTHTHLRLIAIAVFALGVVASCSFPHCQRHAHAVDVQGGTYCFDNGDYNVDIDER